MTVWYTDDLIDIRHGDSRDVLLDVMREHAGRPMVLITDPPYGYAYASNKPGTWQGQQIANDTDLTCRDDILRLWGDRPALVFGSWKRPEPAGTKNVIVWDKGGWVGMGDLSMPWGSSHEEVYVLGPTDLWTGKRGGSVLRHQSVPPGAGGKNGRVHPNEKPVPLMRDLIEKVDPTAVIIDPFMGSGATLRAAKDLGRRAIGIELDAQWLTVARDRLSQESLFVGV